MCGIPKICLRCRKSTFDILKICSQKKDYTVLEERRIFVTVSLQKRQIPKSREKSRNNFICYFCYG